jgi:hypothetical protein
MARKAIPNKSTTQNVGAPVVTWYSAERLNPSVYLRVLAIGMAGERCKNERNGDRREMIMHFHKVIL